MPFPFPIPIPWHRQPRYPPLSCSFFLDLFPVLFAVQGQSRAEQGLRSVWDLCHGCDSASPGILLAASLGQPPLMGQYRLPSGAVASHPQDDDRSRSNPRSRIYSVNLGGPRLQERCRCCDFPASLPANPSERETSASGLGLPDEVQDPRAERDRVSCQSTGVHWLAFRTGPFEGSERELVPLELWGPSASRRTGKTALRNHGASQIITLPLRWMEYRWMEYRWMEDVDTGRGFRVI